MNNPYQPPPGGPPGSNPPGSNPPGSSPPESYTPTVPGPTAQPGYPPQGAPYGQPPPGGQAYGQPPPGQPPPGQQPYAPYGIDPKTGLPFSEKQKMVAGLLQLLIGGLGIGRFYTGHTGIAVAQLLVTIFTCGIGAIWPLIDGILMLTGNVTDSNGLPLRD